MNNIRLNTGEFKDFGQDSRRREPVNFDSIKLGDSVEILVEISDDIIARFAEFSGDLNPLHLNDEWAKTIGFPQRVAHGMLSLAFVSRILGTLLPGPGTLLVSHRIDFVNPVFPGEKLQIRLSVQTKSVSTHIIQLSIFAQTTSEKVVLRGEVQTKLYKPMAMQIDDLRLNELVAIVTGSSRGIGAAIAQELGRVGIRVVVNYRKEAEAAQEVVEAIKRQGGDAIPCQADVSIPEARQNLIRVAEEQFGRIDILVNNATPPLLLKPLEQVEIQDIEMYLDLFVRAPFELCRLVLPGMRKRKFGRIVNIITSSVLGTPPQKFGAYVAAKSALWGLSKSMALEWGPYGVTVNMVSPAMLNTDLTAAIPDRIKQLQMYQSPLRKQPTPQDAAAAVLFLVNSSGNFVTGMNLPVTGGSLMSSL